MDFLNKIQKFARSFIPKKKRNNFGDIVRQEKKQTYLFRDEVSEKYQSSRVKKKKNIFGKPTSPKKEKSSSE